MDIKNLVFEGGGVKGVAYAGALQVLEKAGRLGAVEKVAGSSAGAICATLLAAGLPARVITQRLSTMDMGSFKDSSFGILRDSWRLFTKYGWYKGDEFRRWLGDSLQQQAGLNPRITFAQLRSEGVGPDLYVLGTDLTRQKSVVFSADTHPDMRVVDAVRISMSIPVFFMPVRLGDALYVDGGLLNNYPIHLFDHEGHVAQTLGLRLDSSDEILVRNTGDAHKPITSLFSFLSSVFNSVYDSMHLQSLTQQDWERTIIIDTGNIGAIDFNLSEIDIGFLIEVGQRDVMTYLPRTVFGQYTQPA